MIDTYHRIEGPHCDCVILKGGNIRGERDYSSNRFTLEALRSELQDTEAVHVFKVGALTIFQQRRKKKQLNFAN